MEGSSRNVKFHLDFANFDRYGDSSSHFCDCFRLKKLMFCLAGEINVMFILFSCHTLSLLEGNIPQPQLYILKKPTRLVTLVVGLIFTVM